MPPIFTDYCSATHHEGLPRTRSTAAGRCVRHSPSALRKLKVGLWSLHAAVKCCISKVPQLPPSDAWSSFVLQFMPAPLASRIQPSPIYLYYFTAGSWLEAMVRYAGSCSCRGCCCRYCLTVQPARIAVHLSAVVHSISVCCALHGLTQPCARQVRRSPEPALHGPLWAPSLTALCACCL